ncbi:MAG: tryptophan-rich sensory protein, partial [Nanoarchaeota archaeon]|nr:tryptophan-rich sensory protein [Nanoarchaeota archaeon]
MKKKLVKWKILVVSFVIVYLVALIGSLFTTGNVRTDWYESIKPKLTPPNWVFPIVWNILFFLIALSLYFVWTAKNKEIKNKTFLFFGINLFLNALWSFLYFQMKNPLLAFFDIILIWISIIMMIYFS